MENSKSIEMKEFDKADWETFPGAESPEGFIDYSEPFIGYFKWTPTSKEQMECGGGIVIVDNNGVCIIPTPESDFTFPTREEFSIHCPFLTGLKIASLLPNPLDIEDDLAGWGFQHPMFEAWENN